MNLFERHTFAPADGGNGGAGSDPNQNTNTNTNTNQPAVWTTGLEGELLGHVQNRGWDKLDPTKAAQEAAKAHKEAEKKIGIPADQVLRIPTDADPTKWAPVWSRLGKPADKKDYDFSNVKRADGSGLDEETATRVRELAWANNLTKTQAIDMAKGIVSWNDADAQQQGTISEAKIAEERANLRKNWGPYFDSRMEVAKRAASIFKLTPEQVSAMEKQAGYAAVMNGLYEVGSKLGEDNFIREAAGGRTGALTAEQAKARMDELQADPEWVKRYEAGGTKSKEYNEFQSLIKIWKNLNG